MPESGFWGLVVGVIAILANLAQIAQLFFGIHRSPPKPVVDGENKAEAAVTVPTDRTDGVFVSKKRLLLTGLLTLASGVLGAYGIASSYSNRVPDFSRSTIDAAQAGPTLDQTDAGKDIGKTAVELRLKLRNIGSDGSLEDFHVLAQLANGAAVEGRIFSGHTSDPSNSISLNDTRRIVLVAHGVIMYVLIDAIIENVSVSEAQRAGTKFIVSFKDVNGAPYSLTWRSDGIVHPL